MWITYVSRLAISQLILRGLAPSSPSSCAYGQQHYAVVFVNQRIISMEATLAKIISITINLWLQTTGDWQNDKLDPW